MSVPMRFKTWVGIPGPYGRQTFDRWNRVAARTNPDSAMHPRHIEELEHPDSPHFSSAKPRWKV